MHSLVLETHNVQQDVVVGYWQMVLDTDPDELQEYIDAQIRQIDVPYLAVFGRPITSSERERLGWMRDVQVEEWTVMVTSSTSSTPVASPLGYAGSSSTAARPATCGEPPSHRDSASAPTVFAGGVGRWRRDVWCRGR